jgi:hypothetical protein
MKDRYRAKWLTNSLRVAGVLIVVAGFWGFVGRAYAQLETVPGSPDPILRSAPLETQRIRPDPTPGLHIPFVPGTQTIVLQEYEPSLPVSQRIDPVILHIPNEFFRTTTNQAAEVWGINLELQYPSMKPLWVVRPVWKSWVGDELMLHISIGRKSSAEKRTNGLRWHMAEEATRKDPFVIYSPRNIPAGYSEAYTEIHPKFPPSSEEWDFIENNKDGRTVTLVDCFPRVVNPNCRFFTTVEGKYPVDIDFVSNIKYWDERHAVTEAVKTLVNSFLLPPNPKQ